jgi:hypothetical protein
MAVDQRVEFEIALKDSISPGLRAISSQLRALNRSIRDSGEEGSGGFVRMTRATGGLGEIVKRTTRDVDVMASYMTGFAKSMLGVGGVAGAVALAGKSLENFAANRQNLKMMAIDTGLSTRELETMQQTMRRMGMTTDESTGQISHFFGMVRQMQATNAGPLVETIRAMDQGTGIAMQQIRKMQERATAGDVKGVWDSLLEFYGQQGERAKIYIAMSLGIPKSVLDSYSEYEKQVKYLFGGDEQRLEKFNQNVHDVRSKLELEWMLIEEHVIGPINEIIKRMSGGDLGQGHGISEWVNQQIDALVAVENAIENSIRIGEEAKQKLGGEAKTPLGGFGKTIGEVVGGAAGFATGGPGGAITGAIAGGLGGSWAEGIVNELERRRLEEQAGKPKSQGSLGTTLTTFGIYGPIPFLIDAWRKRQASPDKQSSLGLITPAAAADRPPPQQITMADIQRVLGQGNQIGPVAQPARPAIPNIGELLKPKAQQPGFWSRTKSAIGGLFGGGGDQMREMRQTEQDSNRTITDIRDILKRMEDKKPGGTTTPAGTVVGPGGQIQGYVGGTRGPGVTIGPTGRISGLAPRGGAPANAGQMYGKLVERFKNSSLNGYVPEDGPRWGITKGTPEEWAKLTLSLGMQESSLNPNAPGGGLYQFESGDLARYGQTGKAVNDPDAQINAMATQFERSIPKHNRIAGQVEGKWVGASEYFGPFRRPWEVDKHVEAAGKVAAGDGSVASVAQDQSDRPFHFGGTVKLGGETYHYGTGGRGRGSIPFGTFPINIGDVGPIGQRIGAVASVGGPGGEIQDPKFPNRPRQGIEIHAASGSELDRLYSEGCFAVSRSEWPAFKANLLRQAAVSPLELTIGRDGLARIDPQGTAAAAAREAAKDAGRAQAMIGPMLPRGGFTPRPRESMPDVLAPLSEGKDTTQKEFKLPTKEGDEQGADPKDIYISRARQRADIDKLEAEPRTKGTAEVNVDFQGMNEAQKTKTPEQVRDMFSKLKITQPSQNERAGQVPEHSDSAHE